ARHRSAEFAAETARVATGAGRAALVLPRPLPTPVLAHAVRVLGAAPGAMVTASHNPAHDNGYKVYLGEPAGGPHRAAAETVEADDAAVEEEVRRVGPLSAVPLGDAGTLLGTEQVQSYLDGAVSVVDRDTPRELAMAYTPLHGVGGGLFVDALD